MPGVLPEFMMMFQAFQQQSAVFQQRSAAAAQAAIDATTAAEQRYRQPQSDDMKRHQDAQTAQQEALITFRRLSQSSFKSLADEAKKWYYNEGAHLFVLHFCYPTKMAFLPKAKLAAITFI
jgi:hypothetical protein